MIGWVGPADVAAYGGHGSAQSLPRELVIHGDSTLRQRFVRELKSLRAKVSFVHTGFPNAGPVEAGLQAEVLATFSAAHCASSAASPCGLSVLANAAGAAVNITLTRKHVLVDATSLGNTAVRAGPLPKPVDGLLRVHVIVDHAIIELIVNHQTAFVVYAEPTKDATKYALFGDDPGATLQVWPLASPAHSYD